MLPTKSLKYKEKPSSLLFSISKKKKNKQICITDGKTEMWIIKTFKSKYFITKKETEK